MVNARFGNKNLTKRSSNPVSDEDTYQPHFEVPQASTRDYHLLIVYDIDAPYPPPRDSKSPQVHYLVSNIQSKDLSNGNVLLPYVPFDIPSDSEPHNVYVEVYRQGQGYIRPSPHRVRSNFQLRQFIERHGLELVDRRVSQIHSSKESGKLFSTGSFYLKTGKRSSTKKRSNEDRFYSNLYSGYVVYSPVQTVTPVFETVTPVFETVTTPAYTTLYTGSPVVYPGIAYGQPVVEEITTI